MQHFLFSVVHTSLNEHAFCLFAIFFVCWLLLFLLFFVWFLVFRGNFGGNFSKTECSGAYSYELFRAHGDHLELNRTDQTIFYITPRAVLDF